MRVIPLPALSIIVTDEVDLNQTNARFDEASGRKRGLTENVPPVSVAGVNRLVRNIKRTSHCRGGNEVEGCISIGAELTVQLCPGKCRLSCEVCEQSPPR